MSENLAVNSPPFAERAERSESGLVALEGATYQFKLRMRYGTTQPIGVRISAIAGGRIVSVDQYDVRPSLAGADREKALKILLEAYDYLPNAATFAIGISLFKELVRAGQCDHCTFKPLKG